ncbi:MAG: LysM peptidoglycan-binding domain-containing protein [Anaerolineae bacterium]|nr:LysM peptidoglycan-binding domain-containing protein [Anaerolineae bacterium]
MPARNFAVDLDDAIYQAALRRAQNEGKPLEQILANLIVAYARSGAAGGFLTYTVQRGDTLAKIARQFYDDAHKYPLIQQANRLVSPGMIWVGQVLLIPAIAGVTPPASPTPTPAPSPIPAPTPPPPTPIPTPQPPTPQIDPCAPIPGETYGAIPIVGSPTDRPAAQHGDINLALRGYSPTTARLGLIDMSGPTDSRAPQLPGLFADKRAGVIANVYRVNHWNWGKNSRGGPITDFEVTLLGLQVERGETIHVPEAGYSIGQGYAVMVLYADPERLTLKYTGEDSVVSGYTIHVEGVCTEPDLLALYERMNAAGRRHLPALRAGQAFGRARDNEIRVAIRDTGRFMDPRTRKDWWRGR